MPDMPAPIRRRVLFGYGQLVVPLAVVGLPVAIYIPPFYSGTLGLNLAVVGFVLMIARLSDVVTDPLIGWLSDRTQTRFGRRRPWIAAGAPLMMLSALMLFAPQGEVTAGYLLLWIVLIYFGFTLIEIPYAAWGAELSTRYAERSSITGMRQFFLLVGLLVAVSIPIVASTGMGAPDESASRPAMASLGWATAVMLPIGVLILFLTVREPAPLPSRTIPFMRGLRIVMKNGPLRIILIASILGALAGSVNAAVLILFFEHVAGLGAAGAALIFVLFTAGIVGAPVWVRVGDRVGKHKGIAIAAFISLAAFATVPLIVYVVMPAWPEGAFPLFFLITLIQGFTSAATPILGPSMLADVADLDAIKSGEQRTGFLFAFIAMVRKIFEALGVGLALPMLEWAGFDATSETNSGLAIFALVAAYCLIPLVLWTSSVIVILQYPIDRHRQRRLRDALDRRQARRAGLFP